jgi:hypothetical protein
VPPHWIDCAGRTTIEGADEPGLELRLNDEWSHSVYHTRRGYQVVLGPIGIDLGTFATQREAFACAEENARIRALNTLAAARRNIANASLVLATLSTR